MKESQIFICTPKRGNNGWARKRMNNYLDTKTFNKLNGRQNVKSNIVTLERETSECNRRLNA